jgi:hypothetical protein
MPKDNPRDWWYPYPAIMGKINPSSVMEGDPSPWFTRNPAINTFPPSPMAISERGPSHRYDWNPYILILLNINPSAIGFYFIPPWF